ncbi:MAG TPA: hypothetical protein VI685_07190 [Candidatus Angelobacter sp.]
MARAIRPLLLASFVLFFAATALLAVAQKERTLKPDPGADLRPEYVQYFAAVQENHGQGDGMIFVGVIEDVGSPAQSCLSFALQFVTFRVERVLSGAWTKPTIKIGYVNCGPQPLPSPPFTKGAKWIVFRKVDPQHFPYRYVKDIGYGMFAPTEANIAVVLKATEHGAGLTRDFVQRFLARGKQSGVLFVGRIIDLGEPPRTCREAVAQSVDFRVDGPLWGKVPKNTIRIEYINCTFQPLPSPPFAKELQWIVFAESEGNSFHAYTDIAQPELRYALFPFTTYNSRLVESVSYLHAHVDLTPEYVQYFAALQENHGQGDFMIFVGVIEDVGRPPGACLSLVPQFVTFRVERVLLGAWTKPTIKIGYINCGPEPLPSPPFTKGAKWIVFRPGPYCGFGSDWSDPYMFIIDIGCGMFAPTEANIAVVLKAKEHGSGLTRDFVQRFLARSKQSGVLFVGRIIDLGEPPGTCREAVAQSVDFKVDTPLWGKVPKKTIRIGYINCTMEPLPSPPFTKELQWIVFAESEGNSFHAYTDVAQPELRYALFPATNDNRRLVDDLLAEVEKEQHPANARGR